MARPEFVPTKDQRRQVKSLAAYGIKQEHIAEMIGLRSTKTLRKYFREELARGETEANAQVIQTLYQMATSGTHPACTIFWLKVRAGWREQHSELRPASVPAFVVSVEKEAA